MQIRRHVLGLVFLAATPLAAQRGNFDFKYSLFMDGATANDPTGGFTNNLGFGASYETRVERNVSVRLTGSYDRVAAGNASSPYKFANVSADVVLYPIVSRDVRAYVLGGLGYSRQAAHEEFSSRGTILTPLTATDNFLGLTAGGGVEFGAMFLQYRVPPRPRIVGGSLTRYGLVSFGLRF